MPVGGVRFAFARYGGEVYSIGLCLCLLAVFGSQGIVVKCTAALFSCVDSWI